MKGNTVAEKQSILGRIAQLTRANINSLIDRAEDPEKMLDQLVRDYTNNIAEAEQAVAQTIGNLRLAEQDYNEDVAAVRDWGNKALAASQKADQLRGSGDNAAADRYDNLAKVALQKQVGFETEVKQSEPILRSQNEVVDKLKHGLAIMKDKLGELKIKRDQLAARAKTAEAQAKVQDAVASINVLDPTSELSRYEDNIRRQEALVAGKAEIAASSLDSQFAELEMTGDALEVDARFAALKAGALGAAPAAPQITDEPSGYQPSATVGEQDFAAAPAEDGQPSTDEQRY
ncbi:MULTISPECIES: PspA/IM30 family protein [Occultella]|uniref:PspA/IM30 family protein n=1 Tax=Occultella TaxID=2828348 RepID=UPI0018D34143|nr:MULTISPECIES: PspA/IM30 family protein [Occultella]